jgi:Protein of unknown function (DUF1571)
MVARKLAVTALVGVALTLVSLGCTDLGPHRLDGLTRGPATGGTPRPAVADATNPPQPAGPLYIPGPPTARASSGNENVKPASFVAAKETRAAAPPAAVPAAAVEHPAPPAASNPLREVYERAARQYAAMDSYMMRLRRREVVNGQNRPEELMLAKFRREPWSVYFKWIGEEAKGREVVFVKGRYKDHIHTLTATGDIPLLPAGQRFEVSPESMLVRSKTRYGITDAGLESIIRRYGKIVEKVEKGDGRQGSLRYLGKLKRPEFENWVEGVLQTVPPQCDPLLAKGGQRWWFFDMTNHLPVLLIAQDETGREVEYYCHDHIQFPVRLDDDDFNPDKLWKRAEKR